LIREAACSRCGYSNPAGQKFCNGCGKSLEESALTPGRDPRVYTPKHLADEILRSRSALEGERKQVTVLFADVKGSMELAGQLDPEQWHGIMDRFFHILAEGVHRFEGTVNQYTGDGIMGLFGAPIAHEDHAQRACYAALHLRDTLRTYSDELRVARGLDFAVRIGLNTGEVVVGKIGDDLRMDYTAQGFTVGLAQRMEQMAAAHSICVSEATARLAGGYVELRGLGSATVKGVGHAIPVFELVGVGRHRTRLDVARSRGLTRFVGRDTDLETLDAALEQARAGSGQVVGVVAEAGAGKSRLCFEFVERCRRRGISVNEGHCAAHGKTVPHLPVFELLRGIFDIDDRDGEHDARRKIAGELLLLDATFQELLPLVFDFLGVPDPARPAPSMSPDARQRQLIAFVRHLTQARSQRELRLLHIDDAHWIDAASDAFLAQLVEAAGGTRTLLLVNFRPEYHADWMNRSHYRQLPLLPLGYEATEELLADMLGRHPSLAGLPERIHERTRGNPFFIEEVALSLVEKGGLEGTRGAYRLVMPVERLEIPDAVQAVLAARIDRLPEREKQLLQTASVIGKELPESVLRRVAEVREAELASALAALVQGEFLIERALYPEPEFAFKHPLTHEVAYQSQLAGRRARTHAAVAGAIEEVDNKRLDERAALLAHHWERAGDAKLAARWHARAARWCGLGNVAEALRHWSQVWALPVGAQESEDAVALRVEAAIELLWSGVFMGIEDQKARAILTEGLELAARGGDLRSRVLLLLCFASIHGTLGQLAEGMDELQEAFELGTQSEDPELRFTVHEEMVDRLQFTGRLPAAAALGDAYVELGRALAPDTIVRRLPVAWSIARRAWVWLEMGRLDAAADSLRECDVRLRGRGQTEPEAQTVILFARHRVFVGDGPAAVSFAKRAADVAESTGSNLTRVWAHEYLGVALALNGEWRAAVEQLELALGIARETRAWLTLEAEILAYLAEALLGAGDAVRARRTAEEAIATARRRGTPVWEAQAQLVLARVLLARLGAQARDAIESALGSCLSLIEQTEARVYEPHVHEVRAELARLLGDEAAHDRELREAHRLFSAMGATGHAERMAGQLGSKGEHTLLILDPA
jgi:class 3 adenylate cyclase/tetratricopeptide (TPR) repeat protein